MNLEENILKVSIVIPVYNVSKYIERCIKSVMNQTYEHIECIIVDDVTPDDSITKCEQMIAAYQGPIRFIILHHEKNRGLSAARNTGLNATTSDYIYFLDSDDEISPDCIEKLSRPILRDNTIEMVMGYFKIVFENELQQPQKQKVTTGKEVVFVTNEDIRNNFYGKERVINQLACNKLIKKVFLVQHHLYYKEGVNWEDILWFFYVLKYLKRLYIVPDITYIYYNRNQSITTGTADMERSMHLGRVYSEIANHFTEGDKGREASHHLRPFCSCYMYQYKNPAFKETAKLFKEALSEGPYTSKRLYLFATILMSKFALGRWFFALARKTRKAMGKV